MYSLRKEGVRYEGEEVSPYNKSEINILAL